MYKIVSLLVCTSLLVGCGGSKELDDENINTLNEALKTFATINKTSHFKGTQEELELFAEAFTVCNEKVFSNKPEFERLTRIIIQEELYGYPLAILDNRIFEKTAKLANNNPALNLGVSPVFKSLVSSTSTQESIYEKDHSLFRETSFNDIQALNDKIRSVVNKKKNMPSQDFNRLFVIESAPLTCAHSDLYLSLFDYSKVNDFDTISRSAAIDMLSKTRRDALKEVSKNFREVMSQYSNN